MAQTRVSSQRFFVPDLSPLDRLDLKAMRPKWVFVAESPHVSEVEAEDVLLRRPLCGMAGKKWWALLQKLLDEASAVPLELTAQSLQQFCLKYQIGVINAVQYPLDLKIADRYPQAHPLETLGFSKAPGAYHYKKGLQKKACSPEVSRGVEAALQSLEHRLLAPELRDAQIFCLGNDAEWFVSHVLQRNQKQHRSYQKIPHPSAWWRRGGYYGRVAEDELKKAFYSLFTSEKRQPPVGRGARDR